MRVCLGGTFDPLHVGHEALLRTAAGERNRVFIGLTTDRFAAKNRTRTLAPYATRERNLRALLRHLGAEERTTIGPLDDPFGPSTSGAYAAMVVSPETLATGHRANAIRRRRDLKPLKLIVQPYVLGDDLLPVKATRVARGDVDRRGKRLAPLRVAVGSRNPVKLDAVRRVMHRLFPRLTMSVHGFEVGHGTAEQPFGAKTAAGAQRRARMARERAKADYGIGVEAGLVRDAGIGKWLDVQYCAVVDLTGHETMGHGSGFYYPDEVTKRVRAGATVGDVVARLAEERNVGRTRGAIGYLTRGALDRTQLTEQAVLAAFVPRFRRDLYG